MMFEGFETTTVAGAGADIQCRIGGAGAPLLLLHGYPQTSAMWGGIAPRLAERFTVVAADLRGYGGSSSPASTGGQNYTKRAMAADMVRVMETLGFSRFSLAGHDRGARVAYRMALDHPSAVERLALLDIIPTAEMWDRIDAAKAISSYHWSFLAQPNPMPERLIGSDPVFYLDHTIASWTANGSTASFQPDALTEYRRSFSRPEAIHAACEDYRAGATLDPEHDQADRRAGKMIEAPTLVLWGTQGTPARSGDVLAIWQKWAENVSGHAIEGGHFLTEEASEPTLQALSTFFCGR